MTFKRWLPTFLAFPLAGLLTIETVGGITDLPSALAGGLLAGAILGIAQATALGRDEGGSRWALATAAAVATGTALGTLASDYGTAMPDVMLVGAITGAFVGAAQSTVLRRGLGAAAAWIATSSLAWTLGWAATSATIVDIERGFVVFGASGALTATVLTGLVLRRLLRVRPTAAPRAAQREVARPSASTTGA